MKHTPFEDLQAVTTLVTSSTTFRIMNSRTKDRLSLGPPSCIQIRQHQPRAKDSLWARQLWPNLHLWSCRTHGCKHKEQSMLSNRQTIFMPASSGRLAYRLRHSRRHHQWHRLRQPLRFKETGQMPQLWDSKYNSLCFKVRLLPPCKHPACQLMTVLQKILSKTWLSRFQVNI